MDPSRDDLSVTHLIVSATPGRRMDRVAMFLRNPRAWYEFASRVFFRILVALESRVLRRSRPTGPPRAVRHQPLGRGTARRAGHGVAVGLVFRYGESELAQIRGLGLDVLIRCGTGILRGGILSAARLGVLSLHHGDNRVNRGGPPGFWESRFGWPATGYVVQQLTEELDGGVVLARGAASTKPLFLANQAHVMLKARDALQRVLAHAAQHHALPPAEERLPYSGPLYRAPALHQALLYIGRYGVRNLVKTVGWLAGKRLRWGITLTPGDWRACTLWRSAPHPCPRTGSGPTRSWSRRRDAPSVS